MAYGSLPPSLQQNMWTTATEPEFIPGLFLDCCLNLSQIAQRNVRVTYGNRY